MLEYLILGPLEVLRDGEPLPIGGLKQRATLAVLLLSANRIVSVERIADDLYGGAPPPSAVTQVHRRISELRKIVGAETIETRSPGYVLHVERKALDADRFQLSVNDASDALRRGETQFAASLFRQALGPPPSLPITRPRRPRIAARASQRRQRELHVCVADRTRLDVATEERPSAATSCSDLRHAETSRYSNSYSILWPHETTTMRSGRPARATEGDTGGVLPVRLQAAKRRMGTRDAAP